MTKSVELPAVRNSLYLEGTVDLYRCGRELLLDAWRSDRKDELGGSIESSPHSESDSCHNLPRYGPSVKQEGRRYGDVDDGFGRGAEQESRPGRDHKRVLR